MGSVVEIDNPLTQLHARLWEALEDDSIFCELVLPGNRRKDCMLFEPAFKDTVAEGDTPQVAVVFRGIKPHRRTMKTSGGYLFEAEFEIGVQTCAGRDKVVFDVLWSIYRGLMNWVPESDDSTWKGLQYKWDLYFEGTEKEETSGGRRSRGVAGWFAATKVVVQLSFPHASITEQ